MAMTDKGFILKHESFSHFEMGELIRFKKPVTGLKSPIFDWEARDNDIEFPEDSLVMVDKASHNMIRVIPMTRDKDGHLVVDSNQYAAHISQPEYIEHMEIFGTIHGMGMWGYLNRIRLEAEHGIKSPPFREAGFEWEESDLSNIDPKLLQSSADFKIPE